MKKLLLIIALFLTNNLFAQPYDCDPDTAAPTFDLPYYLADSLYQGFENVPTFEWVDDYAFFSMEDDCLSTEWPPWYGPTMTSGIFYEGENFIIYTFTASDDEPNYNTQNITFHWDIVDNIQEHKIEKLKVYPNPSNGNFKVNKDYKIYNLSGQLQKEPLESGVYILKTENEQAKLFIK